MNEGGEKGAPEPDAVRTFQAHQAMPFAGLLGIEILHAGPDEVRARMPWRSELCTGGGVIHGGALMALADSIGAMLAFSHLPPGSTGTATVSSSANFLRPAGPGGVVATARLVHKGRTMIVVETDLVDPEGRRVARVTQAQAVLAGR